MIVVNAFDVSRHFVYPGVDLDQSMVLLDSASTSNGGTSMTHTNTIGF
jgi:hypothetical protein